MNVQELCWSLMMADTEDAVIKLLRDAGYWDDASVWRYVGDFDGNWSTIGNQQSEAVSALTEKFINAIDARLLNACLEAGIDPKGPAAPATMREAVARFFEHSPNPKADHVGRISSWIDDQIREQARLLTVAATGYAGRKGAPCLSIADVGEGQTPDEYPNTFASIQKRNKVDIAFVQGKFNMGGTGVLRFCGTHKLQLTVSKRNPALLPPGASGRDAEWGFTITRRESTGGRSSVFTYLAPEGVTEPRHGGILSFPAESLPILPEAASGVRHPYHRHAKHGTLIKLYEYDFSPRSNIVFTRRGLRQRIETALPELALPVGVFECRKGFKGEEAGSYFTPARGTAVRLEQEKNQEQLEFPPIGAVLNLRGDNIRVKVYALKRKPGESRKNGFLADYARGGCVLYTVNGQTHKQSGNEFFTRSAVDLEYLRDDALVVVDCSAVDEITREDLFMNSRDRNPDSPLWKQLEKMVESFLKNDESLRQLALRRRQEAIREKTEDNQALADLLGRVLDASPDLASVLLGGARLPAPFPKPGSISKGRGKDFKGKKFPTYFHFDKHAAGEEHKRTAELGRDLRVRFITDAQDDYFWRSGEHGSMMVSLVDGDDAYATTGSSLTLSSGVAHWTGLLPDDAGVGDVLTYEYVVMDPVCSEPFVNRLIVEVVAQSNHSGGSSRNKKNANRGDGENESQSGLSLPEVIPVTRSEWYDFEFDQFSALRIRRSGSGTDESAFDFFYNIDNDSLLRAQKADPQDAELIRERFRCALVLVGLALLQECGSKDPKNLKGDGPLPTVEEIVLITTRALAPVLLPLIEVVGALSEQPASG